MVRIGDVAVIDGRPIAMPNGRLASRALDNRLGSYVALEAARLVAAAGGRRSGSSRPWPPSRRRSPSAARARARSRCAPDAQSSIDVTHATDAPGSSSVRSPSTSSARGRSLPRDDSSTALFELISRPRRPRASRTRSRPGPRDRHRRRRGPPRPRRDPDRAGVDPDPLHALAGRDGPARRRPETARFIAGAARRLTAEVSLER